VLRTDVKSYYASIDHLLLLDQLAVHIKDRRVLNLMGQYLRRTSERGGSFWDYDKGISLGCPLSPLIGAFFLNALDAAAAKLRLFYIRFMDDILILAPTRWQLRGAVKVVNQTLGTLSLEKHPDKTFIGRIERGFDFLGYRFSPAGLTVAKQTIANFIEKASRLYEQERGAVSAAVALEMYVRRWLRWAGGGIRLTASGMGSEKRKTASRRSISHRYRAERSGRERSAVFPLAPPTEQAHSAKTAGE
jgi:RNA-directed DNA polymerase